MLQLVEWFIKTRIFNNVSCAFCAAFCVDGGGTFCRATSMCSVCESWLDDKIREMLDRVIPIYVVYLFVSSRRSLRQLSE